MEPKDRQRLTELLARMAGGDESATVTLYKEFGDPVRAAVVRAARRFGATRLWPEDVEAMAFDVCDDLRHVARAWDPAKGALPWVWAERRVRAIVARHIGQFGDSWQDDIHAEQLVLPGPDEVDNHLDIDVDEEVLLARLAEVDSRCALLRAALERTARPRDRGLFLLTELQTAMGDPSPANTVAEVFGMTPAAVRKACQRVRTRLNELAGREPRFAPLRDLHIVCRCSAA